MRTVYNPHIASIRAATLANLDLPVEVRRNIGRYAAI